MIAPLLLLFWVLTMLSGLAALLAPGGQPWGVALLLVCFLLYQAWKQKKEADEAEKATLWMEEQSRAWDKRNLS